VPPARPPSPEDTALPRALSDSVSDRRSSLHQRAQTLQQLRLRFVFVKFIILHDIFIIIYDFVGRPNFIHYYQYIIDRIFDNRCRSSSASSVFSPSTLGTKFNKVPTQPSLTVAPVSCESTLALPSRDQFRIDRQPSILEGAAAFPRAQTDERQRPPQQLETARSSTWNASSTSFIFSPTASNLLTTQVYYH
jgi:hypothetical protein